MPPIRIPQHVLPLTLIVTFGIIIYANTFDVPFHFDDGRVIVNNQILQQLEQTGKIWSYDPSRFLPHLSLAANFAAAGMNTAPYHAVNVLLHLLNAILVYFLAVVFCSKISAPQDSKNFISFMAACVALVFLTHPLQTQAVTYIVQRSTLMAATGYLGAVLSYVYFREGGKGAWLIASFVLMGVGIFSKPTVVTLPLAILLVELVFYHKPGSKKYLLVLVYGVCVMIVVPLLAAWKHQGFTLEAMADATRETGDHARAHYLFTQFRVLCRYIQLIVFPIGQNLDHHIELSQRFLSLEVLVAFLALITLIVTALVSLRRFPLAAFGLLWFFATLSLESSVFPIKDLMFEHRLYLPLFGFALLCAQILSQIKKRPALIVAVILLTFYGGLTIRRNELWRDPLALWSDVIKKSPGKSRGYIYLGNVYLDKGEHDRARELFERALAINPASTPTLNNLGLIYLAKGDADRAIVYFQQAIHHDHNYLDAYSNLGNVYQMNGDRPSAIQMYKQALDILPDHAPSLSNLAQAYLKEGKTIEAIGLFERVVALQHNARSLYDAANAYLQAGDLKRAADYLKRAVAMDSNYVDALYNLAIVYSQMDRSPEAIGLYQRVLALDEQHTRAHNNVAVLYFQIGEIRQAIAHIDAAIALGYTPNPQFLRLLQAHRSVYNQ